MLLAGEWLSKQDAYRPRQIESPDCSVANVSERLQKVVLDCSYTEALLIPAAGLTDEYPRMIRTIHVQASKSQADMVRFRFCVYRTVGLHPPSGILTLSPVC